MASSIDPTVAGTGSLTAKRPAAHALGNMSLPPLPFRHTSTGSSGGSSGGSGSLLQQKPFGFGYDSSQPPSSVFNSGNLLTPPSTLPGDSLSPISSIVNGTAAGASPSSATGLTGAAPFGSSASQHWHSGGQPGQTQQQAPPPPPPQWPVSSRTSFSPLLASGRPDNASPATGEGLPPPPPSNFGDLSQMSSYPASLPVTHAQQSAYSSNLLASPPSNGAAGGSAPSQIQTPVSATHLTSPPLSGTLDRPASTPSNYNSFANHSHSASAHGVSFPPVSNTTSPPALQSPLSAPLLGGSRMSPPGMAPHHSSLYPPPPPLNSAAAHQMPYAASAAAAAASFRPYGAPAPPPQFPQMPLGGPVMSNLGNAGGPMSLMGMPAGGVPGMLPGGYHSGHAAQMYGAAHHGHHGPHGPGGLPNDRPFKCDQCPQSFNRNHDLKRHKRIHLAVKPFPCGHCPKSFSRKDALKRHILVKGCGKKTFPSSASASSSSSQQSGQAVNNSSPTGKNNGNRDTHMGASEDDDEDDDDDEQEDEADDE